MDALISVITVCLNSQEALEKTIQSILRQAYTNKEYIIVDGGSTDGTVDIIRKYEQYITHWISEKDRGIADAFNKGFLLSKGKWIAFLNAGDIYYDNHSINHLMAFTKGSDVVYGGIRGFRKSNKNPMCYYPDDIHGNMFWLNNAVPHQSALVSRRVFETVGLFDTAFKYAMDYEHFLRAHKSGFKFKAIKQIISQIDNNGVSVSFWREQLKEFLAAQKKNHILPLLRPFYYWERLLRNYAYKKLGYF